MTNDIRNKADSASEYKPGFSRPYIFGGSDDPHIWIHGGENGQQSGEHLLGAFDLRHVRKKAVLVDDLMAGSITAKDLLTADIPIRMPYLGDFMCEADQGFLYAWRGTGKTLLAMLMGKGLSQGGEVGPWHSHVNVPVIYVDGEMPLHLMQSRMRQMGVNSDRFTLLNHEWLFKQSQCVLNLVNADIQQSLGEYCCRKKAKALILDNLSTLCSGLGADSSNDDWDKINSWLLHLRRYGIMTLILDHEGKARTHRGASRKEDSIAYAIKLNELPKPYGFVGAKFTSLFEKNRNDPAANLPIEWTFAYQQSKMVITFEEHADADDDERYLAPLRDAANGMRYNEWWKAVGGPKGNFERGKIRLMKNGKVIHNGTHYFYIETPREAANRRSAPGPDSK